MAPTETSGKIITCILPKGAALKLMNKLAEKGITRMNFAYARGFDIHDPEGKNGIPDQVEKEILTVIAKDSREAEDLFDFMFAEGDMNRLGGGLMYMSRLSAAVPYILPNLNEEQQTSTEHYVHDMAAKEAGA